MTQDLLDLVGLLDRDTQSDRVDRGFDKNALGFIAGYDKGVQEDFRRCSSSDSAHMWIASWPVTYRASTSGLLCRSTTCDEKFSKVRAAVSVLRTALRYGRSVLD